MVYTYDDHGMIWQWSHHEEEEEEEEGGLAEYNISAKIQTQQKPSFMIKMMIIVMTMITMTVMMTMVLVCLKREGE